jgi:hypothetical protein
MTKFLNAQPSRNSSNLFFMLLLVCAFAVSALFVVMTGANVYKTVSADMESNAALRIPLSYIAEKIRQCDAPGAVHLEMMENHKVLVLDSSDGGIDYENRIYCLDGQLYEVTIEKGAEFALTDGMPIMAVNAFDMTTDQSGMLRITAFDESGKSLALSLSLRSEQK